MSGRYCDLSVDEKREFSAADTRTAGYLMGTQYAPLAIAPDRIECKPATECVYQEQPAAPQDPYTWRGVNNGRGE